jgi:TonB family protein
MNESAGRPATSSKGHGFSRAKPALQPTGFSPGDTFGARRPDLHRQSVALHSTSSELSMKIPTRFALIFLLAFPLKRPLAQSNAPATSVSRRIVSKTEPIYPPIAKAAHISGDVKLELKVDPSGHVTNAKSISGPQMLLGAAIDSVKSWRYEPADAPTTFVVTISFVLPQTSNPDDERIARKFFSEEDTCRTAVQDRSNLAKAAELCQLAAQTAQQFSSNDRFIERRSAFVLASGALCWNKQFKEALSFANDAVAVVQQGHDDGSGSSAAYSSRAQAEAALGDLRAADRDLTKAEDFEREAIRTLNAPSIVQHEYIPALRGMLNFHAKLLSALGDTTGAKAKAAEAAKL